MKRKDPNKYPRGLNAQRVREIIEHYDYQTEEEALAEDEAFRRRASELRRQKFSEDEIAKILEREADELCKAGDPKHLRKQVTTLTLSVAWLEKAKFLATLHNFSDYRDWIGQIVKERLRLEESLIRGLKKMRRTATTKSAALQKKQLILKNKI